MGVPAERIAERTRCGRRSRMQQVGDRRTAELALEAGAERARRTGLGSRRQRRLGRNDGAVPHVVDAAGDVPVLAAGGIGRRPRRRRRRLALGAQGVVLGTRFLASVEMSVDASWKDRIVAADATDTVKVPNSETDHAAVHARAAAGPAARAAHTAHPARRSSSNQSRHGVDPVRRGAEADRRVARRTAATTSSPFTRASRQPSCTRSCPPPSSSSRRGGRGSAPHSTPRRRGRTPRRPRPRAGGARRTRRARRPCRAGSRPARSACAGQDEAFGARQPLEQQSLGLGEARVQGRRSSRRARRETG